MCPQVGVYGKVEADADIAAHAAIAAAHHARYTNTEAAAIADGLLDIHAALATVHQNAPVLIADHADNVDAHHDEVHGVAQHADVTRELFIPAFGYTVGALDIYGQVSIQTIVDGALNKKCSISFKVPDDFVSFGSVKAVWLCSAASGNFYWKLKTDYGASGEIYAIHSEDGAYGVTATGGGSVWNVQEPADPLVMSDLARGDYVGIAIYRDGSHADDTLDAVVYFLGLLLTYTAEQ